MFCIIITIYSSCVALKTFSFPDLQCGSYQLHQLSYLLCPFLQYKLWRGEADDRGLHNWSCLHIREGHGFDESCSGASVPHAQTHFADATNSDVGQRCHVAVRLLSLVLQDDVARPTVARQRDLKMGNTGTKLIYRPSLSIENKTIGRKSDRL